MVQAVPATEPGWDPNDPGDQAKLNHYKGYLIVGLHKRVPKSKRWNKIQEVQEGPKENPSTFPERVFEAYQQYVNINLEQ